MYIYIYICIYVYIYIKLFFFFSEEDNLQHTSFFLFTLYLRANRLSASFRIHMFYMWRNSIGSFLSRIFLYKQVVCRMLLDYHATNF